MSNLVEFAFDGSSVRVVMRDGEPWFVAADVAAVLGYAETYSMTRYLSDDETCSAKLADQVQMREYVVVNESGLYNAIFRSTLEGAQKFRKWVTSEVLPTIRKTGSYSLESVPNNRTAIAAVEFEAYKRVADAFGLSKNAALIAADNAVARRYAISFKDELGITLQAEDNEVPLLVSSIGEILGVQGGVVKRGKLVNDALAGMGFQTKLSNGDWMPLEAGAPYAFVSHTGKKHKDGTPVTQVKWKQSVVELIRKHME